IYPQKWAENAEKCQRWVSDDTGKELARSQIIVYTRSWVRLRTAAPPAGSLTIRFRPNDPTHAVRSEIRIPVES
ncbi:MAG: hypothetical protein OXM02_03605, partial [Bacteroidota bacterium]|nr:hypothetical protein [Bacteroidota bacterium]